MKKKIWIVGYGSLMSYKGITRRNPFAPDEKLKEIYDAKVVNFEGIRGFNTKEKFRMDIAKEFNPIGKIKNMKENPENNRFECLFFEISYNDFEILANREGYHNLFRCFKTKFPDKSQEFQHFLWDIYQKKDNGNLIDNLNEYKKTLKFELKTDLGVYYPLPVRIEDDIGIVSLYSNWGEKEGYGYDMNKMKIELIYEELRQRENKDNPQNIIDYFHECVLAGVHGINIRDFFKDFPPKQNNFLLNKLFDNFPNIQFENNNFINIIKKNNDSFNYTAVFGILENNLKRSGLKQFFKTYIHQDT